MRPSGGAKRSVWCERGRLSRPSRMMPRAYGTGDAANMSGTVDGLLAIAAVNPVPWARSQMAFTLAFHIILVPLGVSWSVMALVANYRGLRHDDRDALMLAQRWSKYMALTFAVG